MNTQLEFHNNSDDTVQFKKTHTYCKNEKPTLWHIFSNIIFLSLKLKDHHISEAGPTSIIKEMYET